MKQKNLFFLAVIIFTFVSLERAEATLYFLDDFTRPDSATVGNNWTETSAGFNISSNTLYANTVRGAITRSINTSQGNFTSIRILGTMFTASVGFEMEVYGGGAAAGAAGNGIRLRMYSGNNLTYSTGAADVTCKIQNFVSGDWLVINRTKTAAGFQIYHVNTTTGVNTQLCNSTGTFAASAYILDTNNNPLAQRYDDICYADSYSECGIAQNSTTPNNLSITAVDLYDGAAITVFNASVQFNGSTTLYTTTTGQINTTAAVNSTVTANVTITSSGYFPRTYTAQSATTLIAQIYQSQIGFNATEIISNANITGFTVTAPNGINTNGSFLYLKAGTYTLTWNKTGWFSKTGSFTVTALENSTKNFSEVFQYLINVSLRTVPLLGNISVNTFSVQGTAGSASYSSANSTSTGWTTIPWAADNNSYFNASASGYANANGTFNFSTPGLINITLYTYTANSILIHFYDEISGALMNGTLVTAQFSSMVYSTNGTTSNGTLYVDLLTPADYIITYFANNYTQRQFYYTVNNQSTTELSLYLRPISATTVVIVSVTDQSLNKLVGAYVYAYKKNLTGINDYLVEMCRTDINGQCLLAGDVSTTTYLANTTYRFFLNYQNIFVGDSGYTKLSGNTLSLQSGVSTNPLEPYFNIPSIIYSPITYNNNVFTVTATDVGNTPRYFCLYTTRRTGGSVTTTGSNCTTSAGITLTIGANSSIGDETNAFLTVLVPAAGSDPYLLTNLPVPNNTAGGSYAAYILLFVGLALGSTIFFGMGYYPQGGLIAVLGVLVLLYEISSGFMTRLMIVGLGIIVAVLLIIMGKRE